MKTFDRALSEVTKIGNYAIPAFGVAITAILAFGLANEPNNIKVVLAFACFTIASTFVAYIHRLAWLRHGNKEGGHFDLPLPVILVIMALHFALIAGLAWYTLVFGASIFLSTPGVLSSLRINSNQIIAIANCILIVITLVSLFFVFMSHAREEKRFVAENQPLIDVTPIAISQSEKGTHATTYFSILNYSGFPAYAIAVDLKYGEKPWIGEWLKADDEQRPWNKEKQGVTTNALYPSPPNEYVKKLNSGQSRGKNSKGRMIGITGSLNLEKEVCSKGNEGLPIMVRASWQNEKGYVYDNVYEFTLIGTINSGKDSSDGGGRSFTFIPNSKNPKN